MVPFDENVIKYDKLIRYHGENTPATTQNPEPECHEYMERMITAMDGSLLLAFKTCAENGAEWDGDAAYSKVFELWLMSQKIQMQDMHENANVESDNDGEDDNVNDHPTIENITDGIPAAEPHNVGTEFCSENAMEFMQDGQPILVFSREEDARVYIDSHGSTLTPVDCLETLPSTSAGSMVSIAAVQQSEVAAFETIRSNTDTLQVIQQTNQSNNCLSTMDQPNDIVVQLEGNSSSMSALQVLQERFPVKNRPNQKRLREKKPSVLSDPAYIKKRKDILEMKQQNEHAKQVRKALRDEKRSQQKTKPKLRAKRRKSDSFVVSRTPTSSSAPCTPTPERRKAVRRVQNNRCLFSPSSSAPATPSSADSFPQEFKPNRPLIKPSVKRPLRFIDDSDS